MSLPPFLLAGGKYSDCFPVTRGVEVGFPARLPPEPLTRTKDSYSFAVAVTIEERFQINAEKTF